MPIGNYPEAMYRVSLKAIIRNGKNEVLVVKEGGSSWSLPGGGIDHGESVASALKRELYEEALIESSFESQFVGVDAFYVKNNARWQMWLVYELTMNKSFSFGVGRDADEVAFINPAIFKDSLYRSEQLVYKWCVNTAYAPHV